MYSLPLFLVYWLIVYFLASKSKRGEYGEDEGYGRGRPFIRYGKVHSREEKDFIAVVCMLFFILSDLFFKKQLLTLFVLFFKYMAFALEHSMEILAEYACCLCVFLFPLILLAMVGISYLVLALPAAIAEGIGEAIAKRSQEPV